MQEQTNAACFRLLSLLLLLLSVLPEALSHCVHLSLSLSLFLFSVCPFLYRKSCALVDAIANQLMLLVLLQG